MPPDPAAPAPSRYVDPLCIRHLVQSQVRRTPDAVAITAPGRTPLCYRDLWRQIEAVVAALNERGVGRNDRVALVLPNGPEMAVAFVAVAAGATNAPLNPAYRAGEFEFCFDDLAVKALIVQSGMETPARAVAAARGIPILELSPIADAPAGSFTLAGTARNERSGRRAAAACGFAEPDDIAVVLHTSGTTARPKVVPLTQTNICAAVCDIVANGDLTGADCCLNVMPLFHAYGVSVTLSTLASGGRVVCAPGFDRSRFFEWVEEFRPTWYTAVPTIHQAILRGEPAHHPAGAPGSLRFISSSSAPLPPQVKAGLEAVFGAVVKETYGMTEAFVITTEPLRSRLQKPGSAGRAAGPEVAIRDERGHFLPPGAVGEIVTRGRSVMSGYENNPAANREAFADGWFRTGDQGYLDEDGFLSLTGRIKEIINRGGEKISPREVDERLMTHPRVLQAVAFAAPHPTLGETVAAAVVLREGLRCTSNELREFAAAHLAGFKVPDPVLIVDELPKGPTGKLLRIGLAEKLGLTGGVPAKRVGGAGHTAPGRLAPETGHHAECAPPRTPIEQRVAQIWTEVLSGVRTSEVGDGPVHIHDSFFQVGGDSILAAQVLARLQEEYRVRLPVERLFSEPTIAALATAITQGLSRTAEDAAARFLDELDQAPEEAADGRK